jgi:pimeloyl-ACP methyl ester carboxylesterase
LNGFLFCSKLRSGVESIGELLLMFKRKNMTFDQWRNKGSFIKIDDHRIFLIDEGKPENVLCILHGYPSASYDYYKVLPTLTKHFRIVIHDHLGFGFSDKPLDYSYSLIEQAEMALNLWRNLGLKKVHILAHDYGTSVATEIIARSNLGFTNIEIQSLTLCNGSILIELSKLRPVQKLLLNKLTGPTVAQFASRNMFVRNMKKLWYDQSKIDVSEFDILWKMLNLQNGKKVMHQLTQYIFERKKFRSRWLGALQKTNIPINIFWATEDIVAVKNIASNLHELIPKSRLIWLEKTGHYPMLENPNEWSKKIIDMIKSEN